MELGLNTVSAHEQPRDLEQVLNHLDLMSLRSWNGCDDANSTWFLQSLNEKLWKTFGTVTGK